jgi:hypothetical protein
MGEFYITKRINSMSGAAFCSQEEGEGRPTSRERLSSIE